MKNTHPIVSAIVSACVLFACAARAEIYAGAGAAFLAEGQSAGDAVAAAFDAARKSLGDRPAKLALVLENAISPATGGDEALALVFEKAGDLPVFGAHMGAGNYTPMSLDLGFQDRKGMTVLLLGGDFDFEAHSLVMGPVRYASNKDKKDNPEKYASDIQTMVDNRQKPGAELAQKFAWGPDSNLLLVTGQLHNPEITYLSDGMREHIPAGVHVAGGATQGGYIYDRDKILKSAVLGLRISGKFKVFQGMRGPSWGKGEKPDKQRGDYLVEIFDGLKQETPAPAAIIAFLCASWRDSPLDMLHNIVSEQAPKGVPFFGTFSGGETGRFGDKGLTGGGAFAVITAIGP